MSKKRPEVAWLAGRAWAMPSTLPMGTEYRNKFHGDDNPLVMSPSSIPFNWPVIVVRWPDGKKPKKPKAKSTPAPSETNE